MVKIKIIKKRKKFRVKPNLVDYEKTYENFRWTDAEAEIEWFKNGKINAAYNAIDRHVKTNGNKIALYWEGDKSKRYTFLQIKELSDKFANILKKYNIKKKDRVFIFLPRIPELYICFLGILKIGAIAGTLFQAFGTNALKDRLSDSEAKVLITNSELKKRVYKIKGKLLKLKHLIIVDGKKVNKNEINFIKEMKNASVDFNIKKMKPNEPAFMLYTSGTTGKPKGVVHCHNAIIQQHMTAKWVLDLHSSDILWCTADPGWVTGIAYGILGSWSNNVSSLVYNGRFSPEKWYSLIQKYKVNVWYTAPTAIRMLMAAGNDIPKKYDLSSLRHLCSVGEPLNPQAIRWGKKAFKLAFHDNWWQTETGSILIANYPTMAIKLGSMGKPIPGIKAAIVDDKGKVLKNKEGNLAIKPFWPSMMQEIWKNKKKYKDYFKKGWYMSGDRAMVDKDGYFWFIGRADDVIKTSGERVGPFEVESALIEHPAVVEAGVIGKPDPLRGEIIKAFIVVKRGNKATEHLKEEIKLFVKKRLAGHAYPREIEFIKELPKTRSGKIMRRILKAKELGLPIGDISTIEK